MSTWRTSHGKLQISGGAIRIAVSEDFARYYRSFVDKDALLLTNLPAHGCHITIWNPKIFGTFDQKKASEIFRRFKNKTIEFRYNTKIIEGGSPRRGFRNWYMPIECDDADKMCELLGLKNKRDDLHLTVCNTKRDKDVPIRLYRRDEVWKTIK